MFLLDQKVITESKLWQKARIVLEISYGHFDEDDIVRIEDDFNRTDSSNPRPT